MAQAQRQLALYDGAASPGLPRQLGHLPQARRRLCVGCREKEARYGFRPDGDDDPTLERPRALCFECFRVEITRRQLVRERMARGWNARQVGLPLQDTLRALDQRRRRAQIAARHALENPARHALEDTTLYTGRQRVAGAASRNVSAAPGAVKSSLRPPARPRTV